jgi:hypothetical protein
MNTLHRFTESLHAVEQFRKMWRETTDEESEALKREAENALRQVRSLYMRSSLFATSVD